MDYTIHMAFLSILCSSVRQYLQEVFMIFKSERNEFICKSCCSNGWKAHCHKTHTNIFKHRCATIHTKAAKKSIPVMFFGA